LKISATIITFNEEDRIREALASLACCDELIVVDSGSSDRTREIAAQHGARVFTRAWEGYSSQKNFAAAQAANDWILSLDADERLSAELAVEIQDWKAQDTSMAAMSMPRRAYYLGRWIRHSGWYPDRKTRLYDRRRTRWGGDLVHESMDVDGRLGKFYGDILHFPYRTLGDHFERIDHYTRLAAESARQSKRRGNPLKLIAGPPFVFLKTLLFQRGFLDGWRGVMIAYMSGRYVLLRELRTWAAARNMPHARDRASR